MTNRAPMERTKGSEDEGGDGDVVVCIFTDYTLHLNGGDGEDMQQMFSFDCFFGIVAHTHTHIIII